MIMKYLGQFTDSPRLEADGKRQILPRPNPGENEYRVYFNHRIETRYEEEAEIPVPVADFVSCISANEMTDEMWNELLTSEGFTKEQIEIINE